MSIRSGCLKALWAWWLCAGQVLWVRVEPQVPALAWPVPGWAF